MRLYILLAVIDIAQSFCLRYVAYIGLTRNSLQNTTAVFIARRSIFFSGQRRGWVSRAQRGRTLAPMDALSNAGARIHGGRKFANSGYSSQTQCFTCISGYSLPTRFSAQYSGLYAHFRCMPAHLAQDKIKAGLFFEKNRPANPAKNFHHFSLAAKFIF